MKLYIKSSVIASAIALSTVATSCMKDLNVTPINPQQTLVVQDDSLFNKLYATFSLTGQSGGAGSADIPGSIMSDEGSTQYFRMSFYLNEFTSDECSWTWSGNDGGVAELQHNKYTASNAFSLGLYYRLYYNITLCNHYINNVGTDPQRVAEARFIRAFNYLSVLDLYGAGPFCDKISSDYAVYYNGSQLFDFIKSELLSIAGEANGNQVLADPKTNTYGRVDKAAAWLLLGRLYLNKNVYTGNQTTASLDSAMNYAQKTIDSGYSLCQEGATNPKTKEVYTAYQKLFLADNNSNGAQNEILLPVLQDGKDTQTYGGTTFLIQACYPKADESDMATDVPSGLDNSWGKCLQLKSRLIENFFGDGVTAGTYTTPSQCENAAGDDRALFYTKDYSQKITKEDDQSMGFNSVKFRNVRSDGGTVAGSSFADTDLPLLRLAEAYLIYAEASVRKSGSNANADNMINVLRKRANCKKMAAGADLDYICQEWSREFYLEGRRRSDLVRFGKFGGQSAYTWEFMGGEVAGAAFPAYRNVFAIPATDLQNNPNLHQNTGY